MFWMSHFKEATFNSRLRGICSVAVSKQVRMLQLYISLCSIFNFSRANACVTRTEMFEVSLKTPAILSCRRHNVQWKWSIICCRKLPKIVPKSPYKHLQVSQMLEHRGPPPQIYSGFTLKCRIKDLSCSIQLGSLGANNATIIPFTFSKSGKGW